MKIINTKNQPRPVEFDVDMLTEVVNSEQFTEEGEAVVRDTQGEEWNAFVYFDNLAQALVRLSRVGYAVIMIQLEIVDEEGKEVSVGDVVQKGSGEVRVGAL